MEQAPDLVLTADGSHSLRSHRFGVDYHSTHGALQESRHVFIDAGLRPLLATSPTSIRVLEMGLGTGLNALLSRLLASEYPATHLSYVAYERYPIPVERARELNYCGLLGVERSLLLELHETSWAEERALADNFTFVKYRDDFLHPSADGLRQLCDLIFYDAFAPENQPELWTEAAMRSCAQRLKVGGRLVTYCAKGQFKRNLRAAGFMVEALPGPVGKREITRATLLRF